MWEQVLKASKSKWVNSLSTNKKKLLNKTPSFNAKFPKMTYPNNEKELPKVIKIMKNSKLTEKETKDYDKNHHKLMLDIVGEKESDWKKFIQDADIFVIKLKMKYGRPRPYEITNKIDSVTDTDDTPSFPSGHAAEAYALAKVLGNKYPKKQKELDSMAEKIGMSRIQMGNHFPSDVKAGKKVGLIIADAYLKIKKHDWRKDAKGDMEVSELIIMIQQALFYYEELLKKLEEKPIDLQSIKEMVRDVIRILKEELE